MTRRDKDYENKDKSQPWHSDTTKQKKVELLIHSCAPTCNLLAPLHRQRFKSPNFCCGFYGFPPQGIIPPSIPLPLPSHQELSPPPLPSFLPHKLISLTLSLSLSVYLSIYLSRTIFGYITLIILSRALTEGMG